MVCIRCKLVVRGALEKLKIPYLRVEIGEAELIDDITPVQHEQLNVSLKSVGLELMDDKRSVLIEKIKNVIVELIHYSNDERLLVNYSEFLSEKLNYDYTYLAGIFSEVHGTTIEHFIISHKIERVKELLVYDQLTLTEIAFQLHYSSVAHLSNQFKKVTGFTTSHFKKFRQIRRSGLNDVGTKEFNYRHDF